MIERGYLSYTYPLKYPSFSNIGYPASSPVQGLLVILLNQKPLLLTFFFPLDTVMKHSFTHFISMPCISEIHCSTTADRNNLCNAEGPDIVVPTKVRAK